MHTFTHQQWCQPCKATASLLGAVGCLARRLLDTLTLGGARELATFRSPATPLYLLSHMPPDYTSISEPPSDRSIMENFPNGLESVVLTQDSEIKIDNYCLVRKDCNMNGGGLCVFILSDLHFSVREDLINDEAEILMIDICLRR